MHSLNIINKRNFKYSISILLILLVFLCKCQTQLKCQVDNAPAIVLDGKAVICMHLFFNQDYNRTYAFKVSVDYFQSLTINKMSEYINKSIPVNGNASIKLQFQYSKNTTVQQILIYNSAAKRYRQISSIVIQIQAGIFKQITLDNQKPENCGSDEVSYANGCFNTGQLTPTSLDPRTFISWIGTDINNNYCISHTRRLSRFSQFSVGSIYNQAKTIINA